MRAPAPESHARFEILAQQVGPAMLGYARRRTDPDTAQDVVGEALLVLWRRFSETPASDPTGWAIGVVRLCLANAERTARRQRRLAVRMAERWSPATDLGPESNDDGGVSSALARLSPQDRELLQLWAWDDLAVKDIATVLDLAPEIISVRLYRAKRRLATALDSASTAPRTHNQRSSTEVKGTP